MPRMKPDWFAARQRLEQLDEHVDRARVARFGAREMPTAEKIAWVQRHFDRVAPKYDAMNTLLSFGIHHQWKREAVRMMYLARGARVLDVCGGTADLALLAAEKVGPEGEVVVYDINAAMVAAGKRKVALRGLERRIRFVLGDAEAIACREGRFDAAMVGFGIRNLTHLRQGFSEMVRALRPGGTFLCLEFSKPLNPLFRQLYDFYSFSVMPLLGELLAGSSESYACLPETIRMFPLPDELSAILRAAGLTDVRYRHMTNGIAVAHVGKKAKPLS